MPLVRRNGKLWFREGLYGDVALEFEVNRVLFKKASRDAGGKKLHELMVLETPRFGRVLTLDDAIQTTEADEKYYHEPLVHFAAFSHPDPKAALLIGCDGGTLREVRKHPLKRIDVVDIDRTVIDIMQKYIPSIPQDSFSDPRARLTIADGADFVRLAKKKGKKYDLVIIDSPDPVGPAKSLFRTSFYLDVSSVLSPDGIVIRQTGSSILQSDEMPANFRQMEAVFAEVQGLATSVPTYIGGYFTFVAASHKKGIFREALKSLDSRFKRGFSETVKNSLDWYSPETHRAAMALPAEVKRAIDKSEYGIHLVMDLADCDYSVLGSREKLKEFVEELCRVIGMRPYGATLLPDFGHGMAKTAGLSLFQFIETSGIMGHFSPHWREAYLDIFTCKSFDPKVTLEFVKKFFSAGRVVSYLIKRGPRALKDKPELTVIE